MSRIQLSPREVFTQVRFTMRVVSSSVFCFRTVNTIKEYDKSKGIQRGTKKGKKQRNDLRYGMQIGEEELTEYRSGHDCNTQIVSRNFEKKKRIKQRR